MTISTDNDFALMAMLFIIAGAAFLAERTRIGSHLTGAVVAILAAIAAANLRIIPHAAPAFDFVFGYFVPVLILLFLLFLLFLFKANLRHMIFETTRMTGAFLIAGAGTIIGILVAVSLLNLGSLAVAAETDPALREAGIAGLFASTYIGGSVNYAALGEITRLRIDVSFFSAATATDNLFCALFLGVLVLFRGHAGSPLDSYAMSMVRSKRKKTRVSAYPPRAKAAMQSLHPLWKRFAMATARP